MCNMSYMEQAELLAGPIGLLKMVSKARVLLCEGSELTPFHLRSLAVHQDCGRNQR